MLESPGTRARRRPAAALAPALAGALLAAALLAGGLLPAFAAAAPPPAQAPPSQDRPAATAGPDRAELESRRTELERAIEAAPGAPEPRVRLAQVLAMLGDAEAAVAAADQGLELGASGDLGADAHVAAAAAERGRGNPATAIRRYQKALALDSDRLEALTGLAASLAQAGLYREAVPVYGVWIQEEPGNPVPRLGAATAMILSGEHQRARIVLENAHEAMPGNLDIVDLLARHLAASPDRAVRDGAKAVLLAERLTAEVPTAESRETLAMAYAEAGQGPRAVEVQQALIDELDARADAATLARWRANLERYRSDMACCAEGG